MVGALVLINEVNLRRARLVLGWVTVSGVQLPVRENLSQHITSHSGQLSLAIPPWVGAMSTSQRAVMPCGCGVKAGVVREWVAGKTVWSLCYHEPHLSIVHPIIGRYTSVQLLCFATLFYSGSQFWEIYILKLASLLVCWIVCVSVDLCRADAVAAVVNICHTVSGQMCRGQVYISDSLTRGCRFHQAILALNAVNCQSL